MSQERTLVESYTGKVRVDREAGMIYDCLLLGTQSRNGVTYSDAVRQEAVPLFEDAKAYLSHEQERSLASLKKPRRFQEGIGRYKNARNTPDGVRGDFKVKKSHPYAGVIFDDAEEQPDAFGLSPVMVGVTSGPRGSETCHKIKAVRSVDVVTDPATTKGLFNDDAAEEDAGPTTEQAYDQACQQAVAEIVTKVLSGEVTPEDGGKQVKDLLKAHMKAHKKKEEGGAEEEPADTEMAEELRVLKLEKECRVLCEDHSIEPDKELMALLGDLPDKTKRVEHLNYVKRSGLVRKVKSGFKTPEKPAAPPAEVTSEQLLKAIRS